MSYVGYQREEDPDGVTGVVIQLNRRNLPVLFEERCGVGDEDRPDLKLWYIDHGVKTKIHILQIFCKDMDLYAYAKRHALLPEGIWDFSYKTFIPFRRPLHMICCTY